MPYKNDQVGQLRQVLLRAGYVRYEHRDWRWIWTNLGRTWLDSLNQPEDITPQDFCLASQPVTDSNHRSLFKGFK